MTSSADIIFLQWIENKWVPDEVPESVPAVVIVLRDPYERFLSGLNMFMNLDKSYIWRHDGFTHSFPFVHENQSEIRVNDTHFAPQTTVGYIHDHMRCHPEKLRFFWMDASCQTTVWGDVIEWANRSFHNIGFEKDIARVNVGGKRFVTSVDRDMIFQTYQKDYELIASLTASQSFINLPKDCQVMDEITRCPKTPDDWK